MRKYIRREVKRLTKKHMTNNPFEIAKGENIIILYEPLGSINGFYNKYARQKFIHININLSDEMKYITCAHELGHARIHPKANTPFFRANTFNSINKLERQANYFAAELLIKNNYLDNNIIKGYSLEQLASYYNVPVELIKLKFDIG